MLVIALILMTGCEELALLLGPGETISVLYDPNGATGGAVPVDSHSYANGRTVTVLGNSGTLVKTGASFAGWNTEADGSGTSRAPGSTFAAGSVDVKLYARWVSASARTHTIRYEANGAASGTVPVDSFLYPEGSAIRVAGNSGGLSRTGYRFAGWNSRADGSGLDLSPDATIIAGDFDWVLYARWTAVYQVIYYASGASGGTVPVDSGTYESGRFVTVAGNSGRLYRPGWHFAGWNTQRDGSGVSYAPGSTFVVGSSPVALHALWRALPLEEVVIPGGSFSMGLAGVVTPVHPVTISNFIMGRHEVTQSLYTSITGFALAFFSGGVNHPVERVTWYDAVEFCNLLSDRFGFERVYAISRRFPLSGPWIESAIVDIDYARNGFRLPTEAEWEYAAKGGNGSPGDYLYSGSNDLFRVANYADYPGEWTVAVGTFWANGLGLFDMTGNVAEWVNDYFGPYSKDALTDPTGPATGTSMVVRGGDFTSSAANSRVAIRSGNARGSYAWTLGFRVVRRP